jgi:hypothetical protein
MLGRLRMGVEDCLAQYPRLGNEIFGKPRWMHLKSPLWRPRSKYNCRKLEKLLQGIIDELVGQSETDGQLNNRYPAFEQDQSRTYGTNLNVMSIF